MNPIRRLVTVALALVLVIVATSAFIRLSQSGLSCRDWPACYGAQVETAAAALPEDSPVFIARVVHRIAASVAGILFLFIAVLGWDRWRGDSRRAAAVMPVLLAGLLAWLGKYTPSPLPAVTLGNLLGGMALLGLLAWLSRSDSRGEAPPARLRPWTFVALALVALQIALGGLIGARVAALACAGLPGCGGAFWPQGADWRVFDPFLASDGLGDASRQALHLAHRFGAMILALLLAWIGWRHARLRGAQQARGIALLALIAIQIALGAAMLPAGFPVALAVFHNAVASLLLIVLVSMLPRLRPQEKRQ
ncbi:MAG: COX15/CtaA family protein [Burkholderiales bacterium]